MLLLFFKTLKKMKARLFSLALIYLLLNFNLDAQNIRFDLSDQTFDLISDVTLTFADVDVDVDVDMDLDVLMAGDPQKVL